VATSTPSTSTSPGDRAVPAQRHPEGRVHHRAGSRPRAPVARRGLRDRRMAMNVGGGAEDEPMMEMNMTPLIDVLLVLLVMFIITIPVMTHAVKLDMPRTSNAPSQTQPVIINLEIDFDGTVCGTARRCRTWTRWTHISGAKPALTRSPSCTSVEQARGIRHRGPRARVRAAQQDAEDRIRRQRAVHVIRTRAGLGPPNRGQDQPGCRGEESRRLFLVEGRVRALSEASDE